MQPIEILIEKHLARATGGLTIEDGTITKAFIYKNGKITFVQSNLRDETLAAVLVKKGRITKEQHLETVRRMLETKRMQGETLVELGYLTASEVYECLQYQMQEKIKSALKMVDIKVSFADDVPQKIPALEVPIFRTLLEGLVEYYTPQRFKEESHFAGNRILQFKPISKEYLDRQSIGPEALKLIRSIDGNITLTEYLKGTENKRLGTALVFLLNKMQLLDFGEVKEVKAVAQPVVQPAAEKPAPPASAAPATKKASIEDVQAAANTANATPTHAPEKQEPVVVRKDHLTSIKPPTPKTDRENLYSMLIRLQRADYFEMLELPHESAKASVERAYNLMVSKYRLGDIRNHYQGEDAENAQAVLDMLTTAYAVLSNTAEREKYIIDLKKHKKTQLDEPDSRLKVEVACLKAELFMRFNDFDKAIETANQAAELNPKSADVQLLLGQAQLKSDIKKSGEPSAKVEEHFRKAMEFQSQNFRPYLELGYLFKVKGDKDKARSFFIRALEYNPNCRKAETELRLLDKRSVKNKGLFSSFRRK